MGADRKAKGTSDLGVRVASAVVMLALAGAAVWLGGAMLDAFIVLVGAAAFWEFLRLVTRAFSGVARLVWTSCGAIYIAFAVLTLVSIERMDVLLLLIGVVIAVDVFAYFFGRSIGGPKIAPSISPSKTWAGLLGGVVGASMAMMLHAAFGEPNVASRPPFEYAVLVLPAAVLAVLAQAGDFLESWIKRRADVKDSSNLIPGHGGVLDRVDGLLAVSVGFGLGALVMAPQMLGL